MGVYGKRKIFLKQKDVIIIDGVSFYIPRYYDLDFKGREPKYCSNCKEKMVYDGWSVDVETQKISEWWFCKKCDKMIEE